MQESANFAILAVIIKTELMKQKKVHFGDLKQISLSLDSLYTSAKTFLNWHRNVHTQSPNTNAHTPQQPATRQVLYSETRTPEKLCSCSGDIANNDAGFI